MINSINTAVFEKYLSLTDNKDNNIKCLTNRIDRFVYLEEINGEKYFIKKYIPQKRKRWRILFGLQKDYATHYKFISDKLKNLNIPHAEPVYFNSKIIGLNKVSIFVTKYAGEPLDKVLDTFLYEDKKKFLESFFYFYKLMYTNGVYVTDYNLGGILINEKKELFLTDFDSFKTNRSLDKKDKEHLKKEIKKAIGDKYLKPVCEITELIYTELNDIYKMIDES